jgi:hypothetical protein
MVEEDEKAIILRTPHDIIDVISTSSPSPEPKPTRRLRLFLFGMVFGSILTACIAISTFRIYNWLIDNQGAWNTFLIPQITEAISGQPSVMVESISPATSSELNPENSKVQVTSAITTTILPPVSQQPVSTLATDLNILYSDNFDLRLGAEWKTIYGDPFIVNETLTADQETFLLIGDSSWSDYSIELDAHASNCWFGDEGNIVAVRVRDIDNMIAFRWASCESAWYIVEKGVWKEIPNSSKSMTFFTDYSWFKLRVTAQGDLFSAYAGSEKVSSFNNSQYQNGGVGLRLDPDTMINNFVVKQIEP